MYFGRKYFNATGDLMRITNETGAVTGSFEYDAFGNVVSETMPTEGTRFGKSAPSWIRLTDDPDNNLYVTPTRVYHAGVGRFLQRDPATGFAGGYTYANNAPTNYVDVNGREPKKSNVKKKFKEHLRVSDDGVIYWVVEEERYELNPILFGLFGSTRRSIFANTCQYKIGFIEKPRVKETQGWIRATFNWVFSGKNYSYKCAESQFPIFHYNRETDKWHVLNLENLAWLVRHYQEFGGYAPLGEYQPNCRENAIHAMIYRMVSEESAPFRKPLPSIADTLIISALNAFHETAKRFATQGGKYNPEGWRMVGGYTLASIYAAFHLTGVPQLVKAGTGIDTRGRMDTTDRWLEVGDAALTLAFLKLGSAYSAHLRRAGAEAAIYEQMLIRSGVRLEEMYNPSVYLTLQKELSGNIIQAVKASQSGSIAAKSSVLYSYSDELFDVTRGGFTSESGARLYMTAKAPGAWLTEKGVAAGLKRFSRIGRYDPFVLENMSIFTTGSNVETVQHFNRIGHRGANFWKYFGEQYSTKIGISGFKVNPNQIAPNMYLLKPKIIPANAWRKVWSIGGFGIETGVELTPTPVLHQYIKWKLLEEKQGR